MPALPNSTSAAESGDEYRILMLPPTRRDAAVLSALMERAGLTCTVCRDCFELAERLQEPAGAILMTDEVFRDAQVQRTVEVLRRQPPWSDLPSVFLCRPGPASRNSHDVIRALNNVTVLDRPSPARTLIGAVQAALRARARQYQMREQFLSLQTSEMALKDASEALREAGRRKDDFLAMLAHELRNPLAPIRNATEVLARKASEPETRNLLAVVKRQSAQLSRLVDDLLDVSRITENRIELKREPTDLLAVVAQACESVGPLIQEKQHQLLLEETSAPVYVLGDHARLVQSVANVLTNAAKYTDACGRISVVVSRQDDDAVISVSDNGIGLSAELLPRIFDLFVQGDRTLARSQGGLGIGLSVVKRLIEMHGGGITAASAGADQGSTFTITLPVIAPPAAQVTADVSPSIQCKRILVVDDNEDAANTLAEILRLDGHSTEVVYTGLDGITTAEATRPDVVLLDIGLPDMSGYEVANRLRPILQATQLIAVTGYGQLEDLRQASVAGFDAHAVKPLDFDVLARILSEFDPRHRGQLRVSSALTSSSQQGLVSSPDR